MADIGAMFSTSGIGDQILTVILILFLLLIVAAVAFLVMIVIKFKHNVRIKEVVNGRKIIFDDRAKDILDDGVAYWKLMKRKDIISVPPPEAIELSNKGKKCVECYRTETGEYIYSKDIADIKGVPNTLLQIKDKGVREKEIADWKEKNKVIDSFQPFTSKQRLILINQLKKAEAKRKKDWKDMIPSIVSIGALLILVVSLMIFYADMAKPLLDMGSRLNTNEEIKLQQLEVINQIKNDIQVIRDNQVGGAKNAPD